MKRIVICIILLFASVISGLAVNVYNKERTSSVISDIKEIRELYDRGENITPAAENAVRKWRDFCSNNIFLTNNECALEISMTLARIASMAENGEDDIPEECGFAERLLDVYGDSVRLSLSNIF